MDSVMSQAFTLFVTVATGAIVGVFFDLYRVTRSVLRLGRLATAVGDVCFWLFAATVVFVFLLAACWGEVRFYVFVGFAAGFAAYRAVLGRQVIGGAVSAYDLVRRARRYTMQGMREGSFRLRRTAATFRRKRNILRSKARNIRGRFKVPGFWKKGSRR
ncbi:MAG: spore cortex biosynthesis protein YabQ [Bacillota bacterium]